MMKQFAWISLAAILALSMPGLLSAGEMNPAKTCKNGGTALFATLLEGALYDAHGIEADIDISQGACVSTLASHASKKGVNTKALSVDFCSQIVDAKDVRGCVEHVEPSLFGIFHGMSE
ncbi:MAG: hypothetical protein P8Z37_00940 [Acidobacteriota bacterium]